MPGAGGQGVGKLVGVGEVTEGREKEKESSGDQGDSQTLSILIVDTLLILSPVPSVEVSLPPS